MTSKICTKCGKPKPLSEYNTRPGHKPGQIYLRSDCRECEYARHRQSAKRWYAAKNKRRERLGPIGYALPLPEAEKRSQSLCKEEGN